MHHCDDVVHRGQMLRTMGSEVDVSSMDIQLVLAIFYACSMQSAALLVLD